MRVLIVAPPFVGHVVGLIGLARDLRTRGHTVSWVAHSPTLEALDAGEVVDHPTDGPVVRACSTDRPDDLRGFAALRHLWEQVLVPLADEVAPVVTAAVERFAPDVLVVDQQALAGAVVAERAGLPWVTSASTSGELMASALPLPSVRSWVLECQQGLRERHGVPGEADLRFSPFRTLVFTAPELSGPMTAPPGAGPVVSVGAPWPGPVPTVPDELGTLLTPDRPLVVVTMGTTNRSAAAGFLSAAHEALERRGRLQGVLVDPRATTRPVRSGQHVLVPRLPRHALLDRAAAVVCHAGHNTVVESLAHGVPLVVAPIRDDQPRIAAQVVRAGAGRRVRIDRVTVGALGEVVDAVVGDGQLRQAARGVGAGLECAAHRAPATQQVEETAAG